MEDKSGLIWKKASNWFVLLFFCGPSYIYLSKLLLNTPSLKSQMNNLPLKMKKTGDEDAHSSYVGFIRNKCLY